MLLRRISKHVEDQNWFAVALDFLIVVVGVFIGIQVANWNENRQLRDLFDDAFDRAVVEIQDNLRGQAFVAEGIRTELPIVQRAIEILQTCQIEADAEKTIRAALLPLMNPYILQVEDDALEHLRNNDDFLKYQSVEQREALFRLSRIIKYSTVYETYYQDSLRESRKTGVSALDFDALSMTTIDDYVDFIVEENPLSSPHHRMIKLPADLSDLCGNTAFMSWLYDWEDQALFLAVSEGRLTKALEATLQSLNQTETASGKAPE